MGRPGTANHTTIASASSTSPSNRSPRKGTDRTIRLTTTTSTVVTRCVYAYTEFSPFFSERFTGRRCASPRPRPRPSGRTDGQAHRLGSTASGPAWPAGELCGEKGGGTSFRNRPRSITVGAQLFRISSSGFGWPRAATRLDIFF